MLHPPTRRRSLVKFLVVSLSHNFQVLHHAEFIYGYARRSHSTPAARPGAGRILPACPPLVRGRAAQQGQQDDRGCKAAGTPRAGWL